MVFDANASFFWFIFDWEVNRGVFNVPETLKNMLNVKNDFDKILITSRV